MSSSPVIRAVVIAPTYNNARTLADVLQRTAKVGVPVIAVNDGSTDGTAAILDAWRGEGRVVVTHERNRGKAAALRAGFARAAEMNFTHALTIDTDGQLDPAEIPNLLAAARRSPGALVLGCRDETAADYPAKSRLGRRVSNRFVYWESGARVSDSQCGFRVYPLDVTRAVRCFSGRYGFETEILSRAAWAGVPIAQVTVRCRYELPEGRVSHFQPWRDSLRAVGMHLRLLVRSALPWPRARLGDARTGTLWHRLREWISPVRAWRAVRNDVRERQRFAAGLAVGVFIANLPAYGFQTLLSLYAARRLRLNPLPVVVGSHLSTPPVGPILVAAGIVTGHAILRGTLPSVRNFDPRLIGYAALVRSVLLEWLIGGAVLGAALAAVTFGVSKWLMRWVPKVPAEHTREGTTARPTEPAPGHDRAAAKPAA